LTNQGKYREALGELTKLEEENKKEIKKAIAENRIFIWISARIDFQTGLIKQAEGLFAESISFFISALTKAFEIKEYKLVALSYYELDYSYGMIGDSQNGYEKTKNAVEYAESYYPEILFKIHLNLGNFLADIGKKNEAEIEYRKAIEEQPDLAEAHNNLGLLLIELKRNAEAENEFIEAVRYRPDYASAHYNFGLLLDKAGRNEEAEKEYRKCINYEPRHVSAHNNLGTILADLGRKNEAEKEIREAIKIGPNDSVVHNNLGFLLYELGRMEDAEREFYEAIKIKPDYIKAYRNLGILYADWGKDEKAIEMFEKILEYKANLSDKEEELILAVLNELLIKKSK